jgi:hypothetical protein
MSAEDLSVQRARALVSLALFDPPPPQVLGPDEVRAVGRILDRLGCRLEDDTASFHRRFFDGRDDLIAQVARQVGDGGTIERSAVRRAFLALVRHAYDSVGACLSAQMEAFLDGLPRPLEAGERSRFEALYIAQPYLGGIPLLMLWERFPFLKYAVLGLMEDPVDSPKVGVLLRMLDYYGQMAMKRREADRVYKRRSNQRNRDGRVARSVPLGEDSGRVSDDPMAQASYHELADRLRRLGGISCPCGNRGKWESAIEGDVADDLAEVEVQCTRCETVGRFQARREDLVWVGRGRLAEDHL